RRRGQRGESKEGPRFFPRARADREEGRQRRRRGGCVLRQGGGSEAWAVPAAGQLAGGCGAAATGTEPSFHDHARAKRLSDPDRTGHSDGRPVSALLDSGAAVGGGGEPDGPPVRVKLLSERLLAFRDTRGRVGVIDEFCAHRGVSLWFGRNEENGLRCAYHGWKY